MARLELEVGTAVLLLETGDALLLETVAEIDYLRILKIYSVLTTTQAINITYSFGG